MAQVDLGIIVTSTLKWDLQVASVARKANSLLYRSRKAFACMSLNLMRKIITTYLSPILEFASPAWSPYLCKDIDAIERVLRRASEVPPQLRSQDYYQRLATLRLNTLEQRRTASDMTETYKILHVVQSCILYHALDPFVPTSRDSTFTWSSAQSTPTESGSSPET